MTASIYLDHNATTPVHPEVWEAMEACWRNEGGNPGSQHEPGRRARRVLESARERIGELLGADVGHLREDHVIFTSGGTEANNLALRGLPATKGRLVTSSLEHPSVSEVARAMEQEGWEVVYLPVDERGVTDTRDLARWLDEPTQLISVMLGNNETGVLQPVAEIAEAARARQILMHTDAVQVAGKLPLDFRALGVAAMSVSAHKFHGPAGIGALLVRQGVTLKPLHLGGFQEGGLRPGTEPVPLVVGMCKALELWYEEAELRRSRMQRLRDRLERGLQEQLGRIVVIGEPAARLPHTSNIAFLGCNRQALLMALDLQHIACSTGSACASGSSEPSPVLLAMRADPAVVESALRFSVGAFTTESEIDEAVQRIVSVVQRMR